MFFKRQIKHFLNRIAGENSSCEFSERQYPPPVFGLNKYNFSRPYYFYLMNDISEKFGFNNKVVCEIGADPLLECSRAAMLLGAKEVHSYNYGIELDNTYDDKIKIYKLHFGQDSVFDNTFDLMFAIATIEHVPEIEIFASNIVKALKHGGQAYIQGEPLWQGPLGHHLWIDNGRYRFDNNTNILDDWYHLSMPSKRQFEDDMLSKGLNIDVIPKFWENIYEDRNINRVKTMDIIQAFQSFDNVKVEIKRDLYSGSTNVYFDIAKKYFSEEDLRTKGITIFLTKK